MKKLARFFILIAFAQFVLWSCSEKEIVVELPIDLSREWVTGSLEGVNISDLSDAVTTADNIPRFTSLLVVRNGKLVLEEYFHGFEANDAHDVRSVTKSIVSVLVGIAKDEGFITSLDETLEDHLPSTEFFLTEVQKTITIEHLLTMSSGFQWDEWTSTSYNDWIISGDHVDYLLSQPHQHTPGAQFTYNSAAVHLLGVVVEKAVGMKLYDFADAFLFDKIGVTTKTWEQLSHNYVNGGSGIDLRSRDLAKFGQLILQKGKSGGQTIVSEDWITEATTSKYTWTSDYGSMEDYSYGYLWWTPTDGALAWGYGGQFIYIVPDKNLVVVTTINWVNISSEGGPNTTSMPAIDIIISKILPNVH